MMCKPNNSYYRNDIHSFGDASLMSVDGDTSDVEQAESHASNDASSHCCVSLDFRSTLPLGNSLSPIIDTSDVEQAENHALNDANSNGTLDFKSVRPALGNNNNIPNDSDLGDEDVDAICRRAHEKFNINSDSEEISQTTDNIEVKKNETFNDDSDGLQKSLSFRKSEIKSQMRRRKHVFSGRKHGRNCTNSLGQEVFDLSTNKKGKGIFHRMLSCVGLNYTNILAKQETGHTLALYFHWTFRTSFSILFISFLVKFMVLILLFTGFLSLSILWKPSCIVPSSGYFADSFSLSWTTLTTVGYGHIHPALPQDSEDGSCGLIDFITAMEAFVGVLYAGFCSAIIFSKVLRIQSQAQVRFSDPLIIQYGSGVKGSYTGNISDDKMSCPILEFRIANRFHDHEGCEIIGAQISCMIRKAAARNVNRSASMHSSISAIRDKRCIDNFDDVDYNVSQIKIDMSHHPFFKMIWVVRHVLNESSPILSMQARHAITRNRGYWPKELCSYSALRKNIQFDQFIVNLTGISNISANQVFAQKIYHLEDISIGYKFATIVYQNRETGKLMLDMDCINSVNEQEGGGGQPLGDTDDEN